MRNALIAWSILAVHALSAPSDVPNVVELSRRALNENLPQLAVFKLKRLLADQGLEPGLRADATRVLAEAYIELGQADEARVVLAPLVANGDLAARLLRAHAFARAGAWEDARNAYEDLMILPDAPPAATLGAAEASQALGDTAKAVSLLDPVVRAGSVPPAVQLRLASFYVETGQLAQARRLLASARPTTDGDKLWERYVEGRILLREQQPDAAGAAFEEVLKAPSNVTENLAAAATLGMAEVKLSRQGPEAADKVLETFLWNNPESPWIEMAFRRLDQVYAAERRPEEDQLQKWAGHSRAARAALARFFLAKLQFRGGKWEKAIGTLDLFVAKYPMHRFVAVAQLMRAEAFTQRGRFADAITALEAAARAAPSAALRAEIDFRTGLAQMQLQEYVLAATSLHRAAEISETLCLQATYNAALAWLGQGNIERFQAEFRALTRLGAEPVLRGNLALEEALTRGRMRDAAAEESLQRFIQQFPAHPRLGEARVALAELKMVEGDLDHASQLMRVAAPRAGGSKPSDEQAACLAIFLADSKTPRDDRETIQLAQQFLRDRPKSPLVADVRMKLGQIFFRQSDYPNAENHFEKFAREFSQDPTADTALFLAGQAAMRTINPGSTERALRYFDEVVQHNGPLKLQAREQQAIIQLRLGKEQEAVALYDLIINSRQPPPDPALRSAALIGKGEAFALLAKKEPQQLSQAIAAYEQVIAAPDSTASARHQALYHKAKLIGDQPGRRTEALSIYNDILDLNIGAVDREYFWFYKAGFEAGRMFEQQQQWTAAIGIYEKLGSIEGPHASDARDLARLRRVEHFVWD